MEENRPSRDLLLRYLNGTCTDVERERVERWYAQLNLEDAPTYSGEEESELFERIQAQTHPPKSTAFTTFLKVAAVVFLLISPGLWLYLHRQKAVQITAPIAQTQLPQEILYRNQNGRVENYFLPDGTEIRLMPGAEVWHPREFPANRRDVRFSGEAFFTVISNPQAPFTIESGRLKTEVLGTSFSIRSLPESHVFNLTVTTGKVMVSMDYGQNNRVLLQPRQKAILDHDRERLVVASLPADTPEMELWQPVALSFDDTPLSTVIGQLQNIFNTPIRLDNPDLGSCTVTVELKNLNLPDALSMLTLLLNVTYELRNDEFIILGDKCGL